MVAKRKLDNLRDWQDWHDWISERFGIENIISGDTETPMNYPCIVSWYEYEEQNIYSADDDICVYNFIYLSDFVT